MTCGVLLAASLSGCGGEQSTLKPRSEQARDIAELFWWMLGVSGVVFAGALGLLGLSYLRRRREGGIPIVRDSPDQPRRLVVVFGIVIPLTALIAVFAVANFTVASVTNAPASGSTQMAIQVTGHQFFWEVRYPGSRAVTANEIHIPARTRVDTRLRSADVIHSFWMPQLNRKADMLPGHPNRILLYADRPGTYRGQCAELCGVQHANMAVTVVADPPARYRAWLARNARPAPAPATVQQRRGAQVFQARACASCHAIRGTRATGAVGPDLTHLGSRRTLAAQTIPNTPAQLREWIDDPQHVKPGNRMPGLALSDADLDALVAYLEHLR